MKLSLLQLDHTKWIPGSPSNVSNIWDPIESNELFRNAPLVIMLLQAVYSNYSNIFLLCKMISSKNSGSLQTGSSFHY